MRAYLLDTNNITNRYAQDPFKAQNALRFKWLQQVQEQQLQTKVILALTGSGNPQLVEASQNAVDIINYKQISGVNRRLTVQDIKTNAAQLYEMAMKATGNDQSGKVE